MVVNPDYTHNAKVLVNALTGEVEFYFKWTVTRLSRHYPQVAAWLNRTHWRLFNVCYGVS
jgi:hypothetical protein